MSTTVVVTSYNDGPYIAECLRSLSEADEVLVYDDASSDDSAEIARSFGYPVVVHESNHGTCSKGFNEGIEAATSTHIMFLAADDALYPGALTALEVIDADWTFCDLSLIDEFGNPLGVWDYSCFPIGWQDAIAQGIAGNPHPVPLTGVFRLDWLQEKNLRWADCPSTNLSEDSMTCALWLAEKPRLAHLNQPVRLYRRYPTSKSHRLASERAAMEADMRAVYERIGGTL